MKDWTHIIIVFSRFGHYTGPIPKEDANHDLSVIGASKVYFYFRIKFKI